MRLLKSALCLLASATISLTCALACEDSASIKTSSIKPTSIYFVETAKGEPKYQKPTQLDIVPRPVSTKINDGYFELKSSTAIVHDSSTKKEAQFLAEYLKTATGYNLKLVDTTGKKMKYPTKAILLTKDNNTKDKMPYYNIKVNDLGITINGGGFNKLGEKDSPGLFYGIMTLRQLLPVEIESNEIVKTVRWIVPACQIDDKANFRWRGMHLDVSRHFYPKEFIKKYIDILALHKMNVFHWHLIDDGGWRLEIKKYPKLTSVGAWRNASTFDWDFKKIRFGKDIPAGEKKYGGFYTQEDVKEIVAYAAKRHIIVVPEIEMPGHVLPAMIAYPELNCKTPKGVKDSWGGYKQNMYCAGNPKTYQFQKDVLDETMKLFPSKYIHIGADEVRKDFWDRCERCKAMCKKHKLHNSHQLQSYFVKQIDKYLNSKGRIMIGWDEILEGGLAKNAVVMSWRGERGGIQAARSGHDVIMTPTGPCYFDYAYSNNSTARLYQYNPIPHSLRGRKGAKHVLGSQGNVWTEWMNDSRRVEYMILPRMSALAESLWTPLNRKNYKNFCKRMDSFLTRLDIMDIQYRMPSPVAKRTAVIFTDKAKVEFLASKNPKRFIRYTLDGSIPTDKSPIYTKPIIVDKNTVVTAATFARYRKNGSSITQVSCIKYSPEDIKNIGNYKPGAKVTVRHGKFKTVKEVLNSPVKQTLTKATVDLNGIRAWNNFGLIFEGFIKIEKEGVYRFTTGSDDGSRLFIAGACVVDNDGPHGHVRKSGDVFLKPGIYPVMIGFHQGGGGKSLEALISGPGIHQQRIGKFIYSKK